MPDYAGLSAGIALPAYAGMTNDEIAAALTTANIVQSNDLPVGGLIGWLGLNGKLAAILSYSGTDPQVLGVLGFSPGADMVQEIMAAAPWHA